MNTKSFLTSKTVWLNALTFVAGIAAYVDVIPAKYQPAVIAVVAIANIGLRFLTGQPITLSK